VSADDETVDFAVIGSGPAGQKAAVQAAKAGRSVVLVEREAAIGGACVRRGTIPSKALRESAVRAADRRFWPDAGRSDGPETIELARLMHRLDDVVHAHADYMERQLGRNRIRMLHGKARFAAPNDLVVRALDGRERRVRARFVVIATGSRPRAPGHLPVDHENVLDSDSILSLAYLPRSLAVLGGGVIACEYASIFARLGVRVTMIDEAERPLRFVDAEVVTRFVGRFEAMGGRYLGSQKAVRVAFDGVDTVHTELSGGERIATDKVLVALGRVANVEALGLDAAGVAVNERGVIPVDEHCRTRQPHVYAAGDVIGPPALAATSMEQGRRAVCHALGIDPGHPPELSPIGIYTVPEIASVGIDEREAARRHGGAIVGCARFDEVARGQISGATDGFLKLVADAEGRRLLGAHVVGEGATELVHVAQMALIARFPVDAFIENIFNFPTLAEAYRVAALDIAGKRAELARRDQADLDAPVQRAAEDAGVRGDGPPLPEAGGDDAPREPGVA
jgi:NAD(P) transhydrogenase